MFSREFCEIFKNTFFEKNLRTAASAQKFENIVSRNSFDAFPWC